MTVMYSAEVATASFSGFLKLLFRWRGSIYKLLWKDFLLFALLYFGLSFLYRFVLNEQSKRMFELIADYCERFNNLIPVAFVLGFYVSLVVSRWWDQFNSIPWLSRMAVFLTAHLRGNDEEAKLMRRSVMRYMSLGYVLTMSSISTAVKKRFPTMDHVTEAGFMLPHEQTIIESKRLPYNTYFIPFVWATSLVARARKEGKVKDDFAVAVLVDEINAFRGSVAKLFIYDWICIPLVYTQVVTLAVYIFFFACLMGRQFVENGRVGDMYIPFFTFLQFFFYMGWLKVAETLLNPFGEDDDDFDTNQLIDRNFKLGYLVVDTMHEEMPQLTRDPFWDQAEFELPYTRAAQRYQKEPHLGSAVTIEVPETKQVFVPPKQLSQIDEGERSGLTLEASSIAATSELKRNHSKEKRPERTTSSTGSATLKTTEQVKFVSEPSSSKPDITQSTSHVAKTGVKLDTMPPVNNVTGGNLDGEKKVEKMASKTSNSDKEKPETNRSEMMKKNIRDALRQLRQRRMSKDSRKSNKDTAG